jgi:hypothetical protein
MRTGCGPRHAGAAGSAYFRGRFMSTPRPLQAGEAGTHRDHRGYSVRKVDSEGRFVLDHFGDAQESGAYTL